MTTKRHGLLSSTKTLVILSLLCALSIVLEKFVGINTPFFRLNLGYLPVVLSGMLFGVGGAVFVGTLADLISHMQYFNIFFALLAMVESAIYGLFLNPVAKDKKDMLKKSILCQLVITIIVHAGMNTLLLWVLYRSFNPIRFISGTLTFPLRAASLYFLLKYREQFERQII
ncbi:MAG: folate family ECF transporter S component [Christensenellaceae bacterium]|nr:folate family ECF transporter S component [Christensenellaceae bacterium]